MNKETFLIELSDNRVMTVSKDLLKWTPQAISCFKRKCICQGCEINEAIETECLMKHIVRELYKICPLTKMQTVGKE